MTKLGNTIIAYRNENFDSALNDCRNYFSQYLTDDAKAALDKFDTTREESESDFSKALELMGQNVRLGHIYSTSRTSKFNLQDLSRKNVNNFVEPTIDVKQLANLHALTYNPDTLVKDAHCRGLAKKLDAMYGSRYLILATPDGLDQYERIFDVQSKNDLSQIVAQLKAEQKLARKSIAHNPVADEKFFSARNLPTMSYNELKDYCDENDKIPVVMVRDRASIGHLGRIAKFNVPTNKEEGKAFMASDVRVGSVYDDCWEIAKALGNEDYCFVEILAGNYKKLKLWEDKDFMYEYDCAREMILDSIKDVKPTTILSYTDPIISGRQNFRDINEAHNLMAQDAPEGGKETRFWKLYTKAVNKLSEQEELLSTPEYTRILNHSSWFDNFNIENPIQTKKIEKTIFKDYPMAKYFGIGYSSQVNIDYSYSDEARADLWNYVMLASSKLD